MTNQAVGPKSLFAGATINLLQLRLDQQGFIFDSFSRTDRNKCPLYTGSEIFFKKKENCHEAAIMSYSSRSIKPEDEWSWDMLFLDLIS